MTETSSLVATSLTSQGGNMEDTIQVVIQGGAVGLAALAIGSLHLALRAVLNHLPHIAASQERTSQALENLAAEHRQHQLDTVVLLAKTKDRS